MTKELIIERTISAIHQLPLEKAEEISNFADILAKRYEEHQLQSGIQALAVASEAFAFLDVEEDLYTLADAKEVYHG
ncbi:MAG: hypothetical protein MUF71_14700 [Candidatus Kapabacteria bacterium]|jgi:hypothetical protein|nr:hypothetical protein [Candidatus Kapabacteria bacterium]